MCIPAEDKYTNGLDKLTSLVMGQVKQFPQSYMDGISFNASKLDISPGKYIMAAIEHQICLRESDPKQMCWNGGIGDKIHTLAGDIDRAIAKAPSIISKVGIAAVKAATLVTTGKAHRKLGTCSTCGGTRVFSPNANNLGRAGTLNARVRSTTRR